MPTTDRRPLIAYLKVQRANDRVMLAALRRSSANITRELNRLSLQTGVGAAVREDQLLMSKVAIQREMASLWRQLGMHIQAGKAEAAATGAETILAQGRGMMRAVMPAADVDYLMRSARASAAASVDVLEARVSGASRIPLSDRVYKSSQLVNGKIDDIVENALSRGASARDIARDVRKFVRPDTPGGTRYAAMRLGRTELNNAFHAAQARTSVTVPWVQYTRWNISASHPKPDECDEYAGQVHIPGGEAGLWLPNEVPGKPHPNCLCFCTAETVNRDQFIDAFAAGEYDTFVEEIMRTGGMTFR